MLILIAVFVYFGASSEAALAQMRSISKDRRVSVAMVTQFEPLPLERRSRKRSMPFATSQHEFPETDHDGQVRGIRKRDGMIAALRKSGAGRGAEVAYRYPERAASDVLRPSPCQMRIPLLGLDIAPFVRAIGRFLHPGERGPNDDGAERARRRRGQGDGDCCLTHIIQWDSSRSSAQAR